jgi:hypothetical protein
LETLGFGCNCCASRPGSDISVFDMRLTSNTSNASNCHSYHRDRATEVHRCCIVLMAISQMNIFMKFTKPVSVISHIYNTRKGKEQSSVTRVTPSLAL